MGRLDRVSDFLEDARDDSCVCCFGRSCAVMERFVVLSLQQYPRISPRRRIGWFAGESFFFVGAVLFDRFLTNLLISLFIARWCRGRKSPGGLFSAFEFVFRGTPVSFP